MGEHMAKQSQTCSRTNFTHPKDGNYEPKRRPRNYTMRAPMSGTSGVHKVGNLYRASASFANLEVYSSLQPGLGTAVEHHILLTRIRDTVMASIRNKDGPPFNKLFLAACRTVLASNVYKDDAVQLRAKVRVRAAECMGRVRVSSPVLPIEDALRWRRRLLVAKRNSWTAFRAEIVEMVNFFQGRCRRNALINEEDLADNAWASSEARRELIVASRKARLARALRGV